MTKAEWAVRGVVGELERWCFLADGKAFEEEQTEKTEGAIMRKNLVVGEKYTVSQL